MKQKLFVLSLVVCLFMGSMSVAFADSYDFKVDGKTYTLLDVATKSSALLAVATKLERVEIRLSDGNFYKLIDYTALLKKNLSEQEIINQLQKSGDDLMIIAIE